VVGITDGDTFTLLTSDNEQIKIRVAEIDAPEKAQPYGNRSRQALSSLIFKKDVSLEVQVVDRYGRPVGRPYVGSKDISAEMIRIGAAWVYRSYSDDEALYELERSAKANGVGIWSLDEYERMPPWEWRKKGRAAAPGSTEFEAFKCGEKTYCREMISCDEARFHLRSCGLASIDGDGDGVPCEALCR
jgi:endonuclease YncB( thermonuclease family)